MKKVIKLFLKSKKKSIAPKGKKQRMHKSEIKIKSKTEHVKLCLKKGGPPPKLKYDLIDR